MTPADAREIGDRLERKWWFKLVTETIKERDEARAERDEAIERVHELEAGERLFNYPSFDAARTALALSHARRELRQVKAEKLKAVKVLVGANDKEQQHS